MVQSIAFIFVHQQPHLLQHADLLLVAVGAVDTHEHQILTSQVVQWSFIFVSGVHH